MKSMDSKEDIQRILVYAPSPQGGLAEHIFYQAEALVREGCQVTVLASPSFLGNRKTSFPCKRILAEPPGMAGARWQRRIKHAVRTVYNQMRLVLEIIRQRPSLVLLESYTEYLAPLWVWPHWILARIGGFTYAANLHDPVRDYRIGPVWWHRWSIRLAYLPLDFVLIHHPLSPSSSVPAGIRAIQVPVGMYAFPPARVSGQVLRRKWGVREEARVFLSFGYLRDNKNIDLVLRAAAEVPDAFIVVAGSAQSTKDKPFDFYRQLAKELGMEDRCQFLEGFIEDVDLADYFEAADVVLLTYAASFHSQSGVLNLAAHARKPVLASAGPGPLLSCVKDFRLGAIVAPDDAGAIAEGMRLLLVSSESGWDDYAEAYGWERNARGILEAIET